MKEKVRELYHSLMSGFLIGVVIAMTAVYEGRYLKESQFARFFPKEFEIPGLNRAVFEIYSILFGGFALGALLLSLSLMSLLVASCLKLNTKKTGNAIYAVATLAFSLLVSIQGFYASVHVRQDAKLFGISGFLAMAQVLLTAAFIVIIFKITRWKKIGESHIPNLFLASIFFIQARSYGKMSAVVSSDHSTGLKEYLLYPSIFLALSFACFALWAAISAGRKEARDAPEDSAPTPLRRLPTTAFHCLFPVLLLVSGVLGPIVGNLPVEDRIQLFQAGSRQEKATNPNSFNVIILLVDMLRSDHLGCYGYERETSPFIDEMARKGIKFNHAYAQTSWTLPSVGTLFTGYYPTTHGTMGGRLALPSSWVTMAELFQEKGYSTAAFVTIPFMKKVYNVHQGFDWYDDALLKRTFFGLAYENTSYLHIIPQTLRMIRKTSMRTPDKKPGIWWSRKLNAEHVHKRVLKWVNKNRESPFFIYIHYADVHGPYHDERIYRPNPSAREAENQDFGKKPSRRRNTKADLYDGAIQYVDEQIRSLMDALKEMDLYDNSLIILTSDHGEEFREHNGKGHGHTLYEELLQIPLILFPTGVVPQEREIDSRVGLIDLVPTLNDWLSLGLPQSDQSVSLKKLILASDESEVRTRSALFSEVGWGGSPIRSVLFENRWKYIENARKDTLELYDLVEDPGEQNNLLSHAPMLSTDLKERLNTHFAQLERDALKAKEVHLDEWTKESLRAMGYLD